MPDAEQQAAVDVVAARIPAVAGYAGYGDFACFRLAVRAIRWVGGFGEMDWVDVDAYRDADVDPVLPHRHGIAAAHERRPRRRRRRCCASRPSARRSRSATMRHVDRFGCEYVADLDGDDGLAIVRLGVLRAGQRRPTTSAASSSSSSTRRARR